MEGSQLTDELIDNLSSGDAAGIVQQFGRNKSSRLVRELRKSYNRQGARLAAEHLTVALLAAYPAQPVAITLRAAVLKDNGQIHDAAILLSRHLNQHSNHYFLRVAGSVLWRQHQRTSARFVFDLADELQRGAVPNGTLTAETVATIQARLSRRWLPDNEFYRRSELGKQALIASDDLTKLERAIPVPGLDGYTIRPLRSKRQLARVANQLRNCMNAYLTQVQQGTTLLYAIEENGTPIEAIEVNPSSRRIVQWKAKSNAAPNPMTRPAIERALTNFATSDSHTEVRRVAVG